MNSLQLIDASQKLWSDLENGIQLLKLEKKDALQEAQMALMMTDEAIRALKSWVLVHDFDSWESEITMFKNLKPKFISTFMYYSKVVTFLSSLPAAGLKLSRKMYDAEFEYLQYFSLENKDFISYCRRNATYLDLKYFLRFKYDLDVKLAGDVHSYDDRFSTSHDHLVSQIMTNDKFETFLRDQFHQLKNKNSTEIIPRQTLRWTAPKVALTELVFALHQTNCFNGGNTTLADIIQWFEKNLDTDLGNYHKTMLEIRTRKSNRTKFIHLLDENLQQYLDALDE